MGTAFPRIFGAGLAVVAVIVALVFYAKRGSHMEPKGSVLKERTLGLNETSSLLGLDIRVINDSDVTMVIRSISMSVDLSDGRTVDGMLLSKADLKSTFDYYPLLGEKYNETLAARDEIPLRSTADRMIAASFAASLADLDARKQVKVRIEDATGAVAEFSGK
jgi:hypothetical protein